MSDDIKELILMRMDRLYQELPIEWCVYSVEDAPEKKI
jgi:hypothetical protein